MPRLSCWFIRAALLYLAVGFTLGALLLVHKGIPLHPAPGAAAASRCLLLGWTLQLAMGVAFWILPRFPQGLGVAKALAWWAFGLLNTGVGLVGVGWMLGLPGWIPFLGRVSETAAAIAFAAHAWPR